MYNPDGGIVSMAARDYYYKNYATEEERIMMDIEDKFSNYIDIISAFLFVIVMVIYVIIELLK